MRDYPCLDHIMLVSSQLDRITDLLPLTNSVPNYSVS